MLVPWPWLVGSGIYKYFKYSYFHFGTDVSHQDCFHIDIRYVYLMQAGEATPYSWESSHINDVASAVLFSGICRA